jgi:predicted nucleic acid-binding protein
MITAVDTNVLLDVFTADARHGNASRNALRRCWAEGSLIACEVVWAEVAAAFADAAAASRALEGLEVAYDPLDRETALAAGIAWQRHRSAGGTRRRVLPDLLIGVHAVSRAERLLTRDRGFYRSAFASLAILDPSG